MQGGEPIDYERSSAARNPDRGGHSIVRAGPGLLTWQLPRALIYVGFASGLGWILAHAVTMPGTRQWKELLGCLVLILGVGWCLWRLILLIDYMARTDFLLITTESLTLTSRGPLGNRVRHWARRDIADVVSYDGDEDQAPRLLIVRTDRKREELVRELSDRTRWNLLTELRKALIHPRYVGEPGAAGLPEELETTYAGDEERRVEDTGDAAGESAIGE